MGKDHFGELLISTLQEYGVETRGIQIVEEAFTTLAFVSLDESGDREFSFARKPGADTMLKLGDVQKDILRESRLLHYGTISLSHEPSRASTIEAVRSVRENGGLISFDPNLRLNLWESKNELLRQVSWGFGHCDILKISEDDLSEVDPGDPEAFVEELLRKGKVKLVLLSLGSSGAKALWLDPEGDVRSFFEAADPAIRPIDTTGAGDIFTGAFLSRCQVFLRSGNTPQASFADWLKDPRELQEMLRYANRAAGLSTMKHGGIPSIPSAEEISKIL